VPIYEYRCTACTEPFEELVRGPDAAVACPACGSAAAERLLSTFAGLGGRGDAALPQHPRFSAPSTGGSCGAGCGCGHAH
jgi:putative FmdB family regulatory protein